MKRIVLAILLFGSVAYAQTPGIPPTPEVQALAQKLMAEINANISCTAAGITLNQQLATMQAEIKRLKDKYEPATAEPKKDQPK